MSTLWIRILALSFIAELYILCPNTNIRSAGATQPPGYVLAWSDEFNGAALDTINNWGYRQPGLRRHDANNVRNAVSVANGQLVITTYTGDSLNGTPHYTGMIQTGGSLPGQCSITNELAPPGNKHLPRYGYIEASIDFDGSGGMWSSFWLQTTKGLQAGPLDEHQRGMEMDIVEHKKLEGNTDVSAQAEPALHWLSETSPVCPATSLWNAGSGPRSGNGPLGNGFHTYGLEWKPGYLKFYYDNILIYTANNTTQHYPLCQAPPCFAAPCVPGGDSTACTLAPISNIDEYIILCSEVVGNDFNRLGNIPAGGFGSLASSTTKMKVDYVRHYLLSPPANVTNLSVPSIGRSTMAVSWTAPGDYGTTGTATEFDLRYSTAPITALNFDSATRLTTGAPHAAGFLECRLVTGLSSCTTYYFAIKTKGSADNWSGISNLPSATTTCSGNKVAKCGPGQGAALGPAPMDIGSLSFSNPYPNPARGAARFEISVPGSFQGAQFRVEVFDITGRRVRTLVDRIASQGPVQVEWNLLDDSGRRVASALYTVRVDIGDARKIFPLLVLP